ncbi:hypothetical protein CIG75_10295 [Tumebacillus algifaecis]|uniref:Aminoglycoside phosphotransferase domain-containing protein n=1 Tax=Tumebacillus algifaecis TaxID=1214604 RepID=A0A223D168_9BACL|nr:phosphotransferase [Tumebacillus algifaecis]ASS75342.1 hypothetical protein CIG75_10295 [Tumebacillus algifaecis]
MSQNYQHLLDEQVVQAAVEKYGLTRERLFDLGSGNVNIVFEHQVKEQEYILRLTHRSRRALQELIGEVDFVNYLGRNGAPVSCAVPSLDGNLVEELPNGFMAVRFEKAAGRLPTEEDWHADLYYRWGKLTGQMHRLSRSYQAQPVFKRREWHEEEWLNIAKFIPASQTAVLQHAESLLENFERLPIDQAGYGLIHNDLHSRNFLIQDDKLTAFDFDDCCYNWYISDLTNIIYQALTRFSRPPQSDAEEKQFGEHFMRHFLAGYRTESDLAQSWLTTIPQFMKLRRLLLYVFYHQAFDLDNLSDLMANRIAQTRRAIETDAPLTDIRFESL